MIGDLREILAKYRTVAIVGLSHSAHKTLLLMKFWAKKGYKSLINLPLDI
jgi:predicted CoA-binding protein